MYNPTAKMQSPAGLYDMVSNLPPQQQGPELQQLGAKQLAPTEAILYVKNQLDRLRAARQPPSPTTVMQDMLAQIQQAQAPQQQQQPPMQQGPMQGPPPQQGLPSLPVQNVGQPQNYASGGIVAFQNTGLVEDPTSPFSRFMGVRGDAGGRLEAEQSRAAQAQLKNKLGREIASRYQFRAGPGGVFAAQSDPQRQEAQDVMRKLPTMSVEDMQAVLASGPGALKAKPKFHSGVDKGLDRLSVDTDAPVAAPAAVAQPRRPSGLAALQEFTPTAERMAVPDKTQADYLEEIQKQYAGLGIGKALEERGKYLEGRGAKVEKDLADRARMSRAQAFFKMAEEGGKPGGTFLKGAAAGLSQYAGDKQALADKRDASDERTKELQFTLALAQEQQKLGNNQAANAMLKEANNLREDLAKETRAEVREERTLAQQQKNAEANLATADRYATRRQSAENIQRMEQLKLAQTATDQLEKELSAEQDLTKRTAIAARLKELRKLTTAYLVAQERENARLAEANIGTGFDLSGYSAVERE